MQAKQTQDNSDGKKNDQPKAKQATSAVLFMVGSNQRSKWIVDSGASSHMTRDRQFFLSIDESRAPDVFLAVEKAVKSVGCGEEKVCTVLMDWVVLWRLCSRMSSACHHGLTKL